MERGMWERAMARSHIPLARVLYCFGHTLGMANC